MQLFKDKKLRVEFEEYKQSSTETIEKLTKTVDELSKEVSILQKQRADFEKRISKLNKDIEILSSPVEENQSGDGLEIVPLVYKGAEIFPTFQKEYTSLSFDGFYFIYTNGRASDKPLINAHQLKLLNEVRVITNWAELGREIGVSSDIVKKIVYNLFIGTFDKGMEDYFSPEISYKKGVCYLNGEKTSLKATDVKTIIDCYVNDKSEDTISKICKLYPQADHEYIITICDNYDCIDSGKVEPKIFYENNPQKRKEKGMC